MLHPVGRHTPAVYWRRRILFIGIPLALIAVTAWVLLGGGGDPKHVADSTALRTPPSTPTTVLTSTSSSSASSAQSSDTDASSSPSSSSSAQLMPCVVSALKISALTSAHAYHVGDQPVLSLQVVNPGPKPCLQDLSDSKVELQVYNGESRVWGSHDCKVTPGSSVRALPVGAPVRISIAWSGLSSQPQCAGTRQRVGAGTYTLYPRLSGQLGALARFTIS